MKNTLKICFIFIGLLCLVLSCGKENDKDCAENNFATENEKKDRKVLIIGIDGFRSDVLQDTIAPFLFDLSSDPTSFFNGLHKTESITSSGPNWTSLLTGVHTSKHNVTNNNFDENRLEEYPHFFKYTELAAPSKNTVSICHWIVISGFISRDYADYNPIQTFSDQDVFDRGNAIVNATDPEKGDFIFLHFDDLDHEGHAHGFSKDVPEYKQAVSTMDQYVSGLFNTVNQRRALGEDWIVFVVSDHGGQGTGHGDANDPNTNQTIFFAQHPSLEFKDVTESSQVDLVPTIMDFIGIRNDALSCNLDGTSLLK